MVETRLQKVFILHIERRELIKTMFKRKYIWEWKAFLESFTL